MVGKDVELDYILNLDGKTLVGFFTSCRVSSHKNGKWMHHLSVPLIGYSPILHLIDKWWLVLVFNSMEDAQNIISMQWWLDMSILMLKESVPLLNPMTKIFNANPIWVKLPRLPLERWSVTF